MLYLDQILTNGSSGIIKVDCPTFDKGRVVITGFCPDDVTVSLGNEWGSIMPGLETLTQLSQFLDDGSIISWLSGTKACWKGSKPLTIPITFYVFSYSEGKDAIKTIEPLIELAGVAQGNTEDSPSNLIKFAKAVLPDSWGDKIDTIGKDIMIRVHAGYQVDPFEGNTKYIERSKNVSDADYTVKISIGSQITLDRLLLSSIQITHSNIQVRGGKPLYVKVQADFRTVGVPTLDDIKRWYKG